MAQKMSEIVTLLRAVLDDTVDTDAFAELTAFYGETWDPALIRTIVQVYEQKHATQADALARLERSEARLRNIIETTPVGICITNEHGYYEYVNPNYQRLLGYSADELIGNHFTMVVPPGDQAELCSLHAQFMGRTQELRGEWTVVRKGGSPMSILADAAYIVDVDGRPKKVTFIIDISERKRLEQNKARVERVVRHDLRNPVAGIIGAGELLAEGPLSEEQRELVTVVADSARKLDQMLMTSLDLVHMEEGTYNLERVPVDLSAVLTTVRNELSGIAKRAQVQMRFTWREDQRFYTIGEKLYLETLFADLIRNAVEASPAFGDVTVQVDERAGFWRVDIHNQGAVPVEMRSVFFEQYATAGKRHGNGIGTYVAALITRVHAGKIDFSTSEAAGTHLFVDLPVH